MELGATFLYRKTAARTCSDPGWTITLLPHEQYHLDRTPELVNDW
jgi:hypothetical protein